MNTGHRMEQELPIVSVAESFEVSVGINPDKDITLAEGGFISGTITRDPDTGDWNNLRVQFDYDNEGDFWYFNDVSVNSDGTYISTPLPTGDFYVKFIDDSSAFQEEIYDNYPTWYDDPTPVAVTAGNTTSDIDATLHEANYLEDRYLIEEPGISTVHNRNNTSNETWTFSYVSSSVLHFDGSPAAPDEITALNVTPPSGTCQNNPFRIVTWWQQQFRDRNANGLIDADDERGSPWPSYFNDIGCNRNEPHPAGVYQVSMTFQDGQTESRSVSAPEPLPLNELEPVSGLAATWNDASNSLEISWTVPTPYPAGSTYQIRVEPYNNGQYKNVQIRIRSLPATITSFTLDSGMTAPFNTPGYDQLRVEVRVEGPNNTQARTRQGYDFDSEAGTLSEADISERPYDINGDGQTGLAESIHILRLTTGQ